MDEESPGEELCRQIDARGARENVLLLTQERYEELLLLGETDEDG